MKKTFLFIFCLLAIEWGVARAADLPVEPFQREYIILTGGVSLMEWEKYKGPDAHDHWWANFVRAARIRIEQLRNQYGPDAKITWLVYKTGYVRREVQEKQNLLPLIQSVAQKFNVKLIYFKKGQEVVDYLNKGQIRTQVKIADFEYFGHSNKACFLFDYSNEVDSASKVWLHETELVKINAGIFTRDAFAKSWGCHTGESMSRKWADATGVRMWGAVGRTMYLMEDLPQLSTANGRWVR